MSSWSTPGADDRHDTGEPRVPQDQPPYAAPAPAPPYGAPQVPYGMPYGGPAAPPFPPPWGAPAHYGGLAPYGRTPPMTSGWRSGTITQVVLSLLLTFVGCGLGLPSLILSIVAMTRAQTDGASATRLAKVGWVCFGVGVALVGAFWAFFVSYASGHPGQGDLIEQI